MEEFESGAEEGGGGGAEAVGEQPGSGELGETGDMLEQAEQPEPQVEEFVEVEGEEASPGQHNSSGYASDGSGAGAGAGAGQPSTPLPCPGPVQGEVGALQSDPHQSAFRPALPSQPVTVYQAGPHQQEFGGYRENGHGAPLQQAGWGEQVELAGYPPQQLGLLAGAPLPAHPHQMHQPIARRPITGSVTGPGYGVAQGPGYGVARPQQQAPPYLPHHRQPYQQAGVGQASSGPGCPPPAGQGWGSPSWSGAQPPSGLPPMSMTPPPLSWNQQPHTRRAPSFPQQHSRNKLFGNVQYGNQPQMMQNKIRSKNYPFPTKALNQGNIRNADFAQGSLWEMRKQRVVGINTTNKVLLLLAQPTNT